MSLPLLLWADTAVIALVLVVTAWTTAGKPTKKRLGPVGWSFTESWSSNLTVITALYQLFVGLPLLPDTGTLLSASEYQVGAVLFAGCVSIASLLPLALGDPTYENGEFQITTGGFGLWMALLAVLSGALGQGFLLVLHARDLGVDPAFSGLWEVLAVLGAAFLVLTAIHGYKTAHLLFTQLKAERRLRWTGKPFALP